MLKVKSPLLERGIKLAVLQSNGVFGPCGRRQISMQSWLLGSFPAEIKGG